jgi:gamma-glutamylcyclotransferase (GGCT)/AIG2-like uncharacterized protein YtfP
MTNNINNNNNIDLFVYGVLMFAELRLALTGRDFATSPAVLSGYRRYRVKAEQFPALLVQAGSVTNGLLLHGVDPETIALFDLFEEVHTNLFRKHWVEVETGAGTRHQALVYIAGSVLKRSDLSGLWDPGQFAGVRLKIYIDTVVSGFLQELARNEQRILP